MTMHQFDLFESNLSGIDLVAHRTWSQGRPRELESAILAIRQHQDWCDAHGVDKSPLNRSSHHALTRGLVAQVNFKPAGLSGHGGYIAIASEVGRQALSRGLPIRQLDDKKNMTQFLSVAFGCDLEIDLSSHGIEDLRATLYRNTDRPLIKLYRNTQRIKTHKLEYWEVINVLHEVAHLLVDDRAWSLGIRPGKYTKVHSKGNNPGHAAEVAANQMARFLLMPLSVLRRDWAKLHGDPHVTIDVDESISSINEIAETQARRLPNYSNLPVHEVANLLTKYELVKKKKKSSFFPDRFKFSLRHDKSSLDIDYGRD